MNTPMRTVPWLAGLIVLSFNPCLRAEEPAVNKAYLDQVEKATNQLTRDLEQLQDTIIGELEGKKERDLYRQVESVLVEVDRFQSTLKVDATRAAIYASFDMMDEKLAALLKLVRAQGASQRSLQRSASYVDASNEQLHYVISEGDLSEARIRQVVQRQVRAMAAAARLLKLTADYSLGETPGRTVLLQDIAQFVEASEVCQKSLLGDLSEEQMQKAFAAMDGSWAKVARGFSVLPPKENTYLLRSALRLDRLHERLFKILKMPGKRTALTVRI